MNTKSMILKQGLNPDTAPSRLEMMNVLDATIDTLLGHIQNKSAASNRIKVDYLAKHADLIRTGEAEMPRDLLVLLSSAPELKVK